MIWRGRPTADILDRKQVKRVLDLLLASLGLCLLAPVLAVLVVLVRLNMGSPVLFRQRRPGLHGRPFMLLKFRTMTDQRDVQGHLLPDEQRLTGLGKFLRATSLDELPELWNVLKGNMSLVGPRPLLVDYLNRYTPQQARRHEVKPGITGWAQINGRQNITFSRRIELDVWYVDHQSVWLDVWILLITIPKILMAAGVKTGQSIQEVDDLPPPANHRDNQPEN